MVNDTVDPVQVGVSDAEAPVAAAAAAGESLAVPEAPPSGGADSPEKDDDAHTKSIFINENKKAEEFRNYGKGSPRYETVRAFYEEQHAKQTYEFATAMLKEYTATSRCTMPVWEALMCVCGVVCSSSAASMAAAAAAPVPLSMLAGPATYPTRNAHSTTGPLCQHLRWVSRFLLLCVL